MREQRTSQTFQYVQDNQAQAGRDGAPGQTQPNGLHQVAGTPVSYQTLVQHLPPVPVAAQPVYHPQVLNYWKRR